MKWVKKGIFIIIFVLNILFINALQAKIEIKNVGLITLKNFNFTAIPQEFNDALNTCHLTELLPNNIYTCNVVIDESNMLGDINFEVYVTANTNISKVKTITKHLGNYFFEYPIDKKDGRYVLMNGYNAAIKTGYIEDFTYTSNKPIYGAWEIRNFNDFTNKCFVGDCTQNNLRDVVCIDNNNLITEEQYVCDKWERVIFDTGGFPYSAAHYCNNGSYYSYANSNYWGFDCQNHITVNFYYLYNDNPSYEGYSSDWRQRWEAHFNRMKEDFANKYNIILNANFYEEKLLNDTHIPAAYNGIQYMVKNHWITSSQRNIAIRAGKLNPMDYGYQCPGLNLYEENPCESATGGLYIHIADYYDTAKNEGYYTLYHEFGHSLGCPHTGVGGSLGATLYVEDAMSYGFSPGEFVDYLYDCRITAWSIGKNV